MRPTVISSDSLREKAYHSTADGFQQSHPLCSRFANHRRPDHCFSQYRRNFIIFLEKMQHQFDSVRCFDYNKKKWWVIVLIISEEYVKKLLPRRCVTAHKGNFGKILLLCGSVGFTGAAAMAANAAVRCGAGLVYIGVPDAVYPIVATKLDEPMVFPLPSDGGTLSSSAMNWILEKLPQMDAVLVGPGLGKTQGVFECIHAVLQESNIPVVLDADGINVLSNHINILRERTCPVILTPHPGEFKRLGGDLSVGREQAAITLAREFHCVCLLKGHHTVITDGETVFTNPTGNPGMATGGSGDVLAGMITALLGQGLSPIEAAAAGAWLHGAAGDICAEEIGQYGMLPTDIIRTLPRLLP